MLRPPIDIMPLRDLREERRALEAKMNDETITPKEADWLTEIKRAIDRIERAGRATMWL